MIPGIFAAQAMGSGGGGGTAPVVLDVTTTNSTASLTTPHSFNYPATVNAGDLLVAVIGNASTQTMTTPGTWTPIDSDVNSALRQSVIAKVASGTEGGTTFSVSFGGNVRAGCHVYRIQSGTYGAGIEADMAAGTSTSPDPPNLSPSFGGAANLYIAAMTLSGLSNTLSAYPLPDNQANMWPASAASSYVRMAVSSDEGGASLNPGPYTVTASQNWVCATIAVQGT